MYPPWLEYRGRLVQRQQHQLCDRMMVENVTKSEWQFALLSSKGQTPTLSVVEAYGWRENLSADIVCILSNDAAVNVTIRRRDPRTED